MIKAYEGFINLKYKPKKTDVIVQYRVVPSKGFTFKQAAEMTAGESSIGTWTEVSTMKPKIQKLAPTVFYTDKKNHRIRKLPRTTNSFDAK